MNPHSIHLLLDIQETIECGLTLKLLRDMTRTYSRNKALQIATYEVSTHYQTIKLKNVRKEQINFSFSGGEKQLVPITKFGLDGVAIKINSR